MPSSAQNRVWSLWLGGAAGGAPRREEEQRVERAPVRRDLPLPAGASLDQRRIGSSCRNPSTRTLKSATTCPSLRFSRLPRSRHAPLGQLRLGDRHVLRIKCRSRRAVPIADQRRQESLAHVGEHRFEAGRGVGGVQSRQRILADDRLRDRFGLARPSQCIQTERAVVDGLPGDIGRSRAVQVAQGSQGVLVRGRRIQILGRGQRVLTPTPPRRRSA